MIDIAGGTVTIEDSTVKDSFVSGMRVLGGVTGSAATVTVRRSMFQRNGFSADPAWRWAERYSGEYDDRGLGVLGEFRQGRHRLLGWR